MVKENYKALLGQTIKVLAEGFDSEQLVYYGRAYFNAPEIDGKVFFKSAEKVGEGDFVSVLIEDAMEYDLYGKKILNNKYLILPWDLLDFIIAILFSVLP